MRLAPAHVAPQTLEREFDTSGIGLGRLGSIGHRKRIASCGASDGHSGDTFCISRSCRTCNRGNWNRHVSRAVVTILGSSGPVVTFLGRWLLFWVLQGRWLHFCSGGHVFGFFWAGGYVSGAVVTFLGTSGPVVTFLRRWSWRPWPQHSPTY